jgi:hypothetical protein
MNRCPTCNATYPAKFRFCLTDATPLVPVSPPERVQDGPRAVEADPVPRALSLAPTSRLPIVVGAALGVALLGSMGYAVMSSRLPSADAQAAHGELPPGSGGNIGSSHGGGAPAVGAPPSNVGAPPSNVGGCNLTSGPLRAGRRASVGEGLHLAAAGARVAIGWVTGPTHRHGNDDAAVVVVRPDGNLAETVDPEQPDETAGNEYTLEEVSLVAPRFNESGELVTVVDRVSRGPQGGLTVACGALRNTFASVQFDGVNRLETIARGTSHACKTILASRPFVVGVRARVGSDEYLPQEDLALTFADQAGEGPARITLDLNARRAFGAANEVRILRDRSPGALSGITVANGHTLIAFRYDAALYAAWVDAELGLVGAPHRLRTLGGAPGHPFLGASGQTAVIVFADRGPSPHRGRHDPSVTPPPYTLFAARLGIDGTPEVPVALATEGDRLEDEFSPSVAPLADGTWLIGWSYGPREMHHNSTGSQRMYLRRYGADLSPRGAPLWVNPAGSGSDGRFVTSGNHFTLAVMTGRSRDRQVDVWSGSCGDP